MKVLIGLGNPGFQYQKNRHNVGHAFIDFVNEQVKSQKLKVKSEDVKCLKTDCFMNVSGLFIKKLNSNLKVSRHKVGIRDSEESGQTSNLYIVHDDLDIPFGKFKIQFGTGPKLHNGIRSIEDELGTNEFWRIRIGVDNRGENKVDGETYSLEDFTEEEHKQLQSVFENVYKQLTQ